MSNDAGGGSRRGDPAGKRPSVPGDSDAWAVVSYLLAGVGFWAFVGWLLDRWLDTRFLVMIGVFVGFVGAFYLIIRRFNKT